MLFVYVVKQIVSFLPRDIYAQCNKCCHSVSVRPSIYLSHWCIVSKQQKTTDLIVKQLALDCSLRDSSLQTPNMEHRSSGDHPYQGVK